MIHVDRAAANMERRRHEALNAEQFETDRSANYINYGIECAHFMKVHLLDRLVVDTRLGFRQTRKDLRRAILNTLGQTRLVNDLENIGKMAVCMFVCSLHARVCRTYAGAIDSLEIDRVA